MKMECKDSLQYESSGEQKIFQRLRLNNTHTSSEPNITVTRRERLLLLLSEFVQAQAAQGEPPKGLEQSFAAVLQVSPSLLSQLKKSRPISDKVARQIEVACRVPNGWLDQPVEHAGPDPAEEAFIEMARQAWRKANSKQKKALRSALNFAMEGRASSDSKN